MSTKEIVTLQIGHYANFVGAHWWNIQESSFCYDEHRAPYLDINHAVLFREGQNLRREVTFTPRLISIDLKGSLKTLKQEGTLYEWHDSKQPETLWHENIDLYKTEPLRKNEFLEDLDKEESAYYKNSPSLLRDEDKDVCQTDTCGVLQVSRGGQNLAESTEKLYNLDDSVQVWSDYLKTHFHPRSVALIEDYFHEDELEPFDTYGCGIQAYKNEINRDAVEERLRFFTEECDYLQGFNLLIDGYNGFAGLSNGILQYLNDEYPRKPQICFPLYQPIYKQIHQAQMRTEEVHRLFTSLLCFESLADYSSIFCPISTSREISSSQDRLLSSPLLSYNPSLPYHTSSILAAALETVTMAVRTKHSPALLSEVSHNLGQLGRKMAILGLSFPFPMKEDENFPMTLDHCQAKPLLHSLTPHCEVLSFDPTIQMAVLRGIPKEKIYTPHMSLYHQVSAHELFLRHLQHHSPRSMIALTIVHEPLKTWSPFPNIFSSSVNSYGFTGRKAGRERVKCVPCAASLISSTSAVHLLENLLREASKTNFGKYHHCLETGIEGDDVLEMLHSLSSLRDNYLEHATHDSDDDDDL